MLVAEREQESYKSRHDLMVGQGVEKHPLGNSQVRPGIGRGDKSIATKSQNTRVCIYSQAYMNLCLGSAFDCFIGETKWSSKTSKELALAVR